MLAYDDAYIYLYEVCILIGERTDTASESSVQDSQPTNTARTTLLIHCLEAVKSFFNRYFQLSEDEVRSHSFVEKGQLAHALVVLIKLPFCTDTGLDAASWRQACDVETYLEALSECIDRVQPKSDLCESYWQFRDTAARIKAWYQRMMFFGTAGATEDFKNMSPLHLAEIARKEPLLTMDFSGFDFSSMETMFLPDGASWE